MKTRFPASDPSKCVWYVVDAAGKTLGRLIARVALVLRGKHKVSWSPHTDIGDNVIVVNAAAVQVSGAKEKQKIYYRHTGYPGGIKQETLAELRAKHPERIIERAVRGMLPKGPLGRRMYAKLKVFAGPEHSHEAQQPMPLDIASRAK